MTALIFSRSLPRFSARLTSRRNCPDRTGVSTSDAQVLEKLAGGSEALAFALFEFGYRLARRDVRRFHRKGKRLVRGDPISSVRLASGDVCVLAGASRRAYHGVDRIIGGSSRLIEGGGRISLTLRRAAP